MREPFLSAGRAAGSLSRSPSLETYFVLPFCSVMSFFFLLGFCYSSLGVFRSPLSFFGRLFVLALSLVVVVVKVKKGGRRRGEHQGKSPPPLSISTLSLTCFFLARSLHGSLDAADGLSVGAVGRRRLGQRAVEGVALEAAADVLREGQRGQGAPQPRRVRHPVVVARLDSFSRMGGLMDGLVGRSGKR